MRLLIITLCLLAGLYSQKAQAQDHGSLTYLGETVKLTGYRTRMSDGKRWVIADGKQAGKLYSITVTLRPDVQQTGSVPTDATHSATLTVSKPDYTEAQNFCFDGGGLLQVTPQNGSLAVQAQNLPAGNCFGQKKEGPAPLSFAIKP